MDFDIQRKYCAKTPGLKEGMRRTGGFQWDENDKPLCFPSLPPLIFQWGLVPMVSLFWSSSSSACFSIKLNPCGNLSLSSGSHLIYPQHVQALPSLPLPCLCHLTQILYLFRVLHTQKVFVVVEPFPSWKPLAKTSYHHHHPPHGMSLPHHFWDAASRDAHIQWDAA